MHALLQVSCGTFHSAALTIDGKLYTFGDGSYGQVSVAYFVLHSAHLTTRSSATAARIAASTPAEYSCRAWLTWHAAATTRWRLRVSWSPVRSPAARQQWRLPLHVGLAGAGRPDPASIVQLEAGDDAADMGRPYSDAHVPQGLMGILALCTGVGRKSTAMPISTGPTLAPGGAQSAAGDAGGLQGGGQTHSHS
jgi:hypothetical protein